MHYTECPPQKNYPVSGKRDLVQFKIKFFERLKKQKNRADSFNIEPFKNINFQRSYGRFLWTGVNFFGSPGIVGPVQQRTSPWSQGTSILGQRGSFGFWRVQKYQILTELHYFEVVNGATFLGHPVCHSFALHKLGNIHCRLWLFNWWSTPSVLLKSSKIQSQITKYV